MLRKQKNERRAFGSSGKALLSVETTDDGEAYLRELSLGGDSDIRTEDIVGALNDHYGIVAGIDTTFIDRILTQAKKEPEREYFGKKDLLVTSDVPHVRSVDGTVEYRFLKMVTRSANLPYRELRTAFKEPDIRGVLSRDLSVVAARPGAELATRIAPSEGSDGCDIFGNTTVKAHRPAAVQMLAGSNVEILDDTAIAKTFGYVSILNNIVSVISPIWISSDNLEAHYIHFPHAGPQVIPQADWIFDLFGALSLTVPPVERTIGTMIRNLVDSGAKKGASCLPGAHLLYRGWMAISNAMSTRMGYTSRRCRRERSTRIFCSHP